MNGFFVREATMNDVTAVAKLFNAYRVFYFQTSDLDGAKTFLQERLSKKESTIFIALAPETDELVGFVQLYPTFSSISMRRSWVLNDLFVSQKHQGRGIGKQLLDEAKNYALYTGSKGLELATASANHRAQKLYEQCGYKRDEDFYHYYLSV
jgi:ribosomal protein S18 acetylase RimI-like enzyme